MDLNQISNHTRYNLTTKSIPVVLFSPSLNCLRARSRPQPELPHLPGEELILLAKGQLGWVNPGLRLKLVLVDAIVSDYHHRPGVVDAAGALAVELLR